MLLPWLFLLWLLALWPWLSPEPVLGPWQKRHSFAQKRLTEARWSHRERHDAYIDSHSTYPPFTKEDLRHLTHNTLEHLRIAEHPKYWYHTRKASHSPQPPKSTWRMYHIRSLVNTHHETPKRSPRPASTNPRLRAFSPLCPPEWAATALQSGSTFFQAPISRTSSVESWCPRARTSWRCSRRIVSGWRSCKASIVTSWRSIQRPFWWMTCGRPSSILPRGCLAKLEWLEWQRW